MEIVGGCSFKERHTLKEWDRAGKLKKAKKLKTPENLLKFSLLFSIQQLSVQIPKYNRLSLRCLSSLSQAGFLGVVASLNIGFPRHTRITKPQAFTPLSLKNSKKTEATPSPHPYCIIVGRMWGVLFRSETDKIWLPVWMGSQAPLPTDFGSRPREIQFKSSEFFDNLALTFKIISLFTFKAAHPTQEK